MMTVKPFTAGGALEVISQWENMEDQDRSPECLGKGKCQELGWCENGMEDECPFLSGSSSSHYCLSHCSLKG